MCDDNIFHQWSPRNIHSNLRLTDEVKKCTEKWNL